MAKILLGFQSCLSLQSREPSFPILLPPDHPHFSVLCHYFLYDPHLFPLLHDADLGNALSGLLAHFAQFISFGEKVLEITNW